MSNEDIAATQKRVDLGPLGGIQYQFARRRKIEGCAYGADYRILALRRLIRIDRGGARTRIWWLLDNRPETTACLVLTFTTSLYAFTISIASPLRGLHST